MQAGAQKLVNITTQTVGCDCGAQYDTGLVKLGTREVRQHPVCPACAAKRTVRGEAEEKALQADAQWRAICPPIYQTTIAAQLPCGMAEASRVEEWRPKPDGRGLLISGDSGRGKTRIMWLGARQWIKAGISISAVDDPTLSIAYSDALGCGRAMDFIDDLTRPSLLLWDDFGKAKASDRYRELAYLVIEKRMQQMRPIVVTTQLDGGDSHDLFGDRDGSAIVRRLREFCEVVTL